MSDVGTTVITSFVSAFTLFLALAAFTSRQTRDVKGDIGELRTELKGDIGTLRGEITDLRSEVRSDIRRLDEKFDRLTFELLRHVRDGGHPTPPQAA
jgi:hypothetical protein